MQSHDTAETSYDHVDDHDFYHNETEISDEFNFVQRAWLQYEDCQVKVPYEECIRILKKIENSVIRHGMFSPNEGIEEVPTENLKYLLLPFYLADIFGRMQENRKGNLALSKSYFDEFVKLCNHYELVTKDQRKQWKTRFDDVNYEPSREEKIQAFKDKKELENQIKNFDQIKDEDHQREILLLNIKTKILKAIDDVRMIHMEAQIHDHKEKLEKEKKQNPNAPEQKVEPKKMKVWHVPKANPQSQNPYLVSNNNHAHGCQSCDPLYNMKIKEEMKAKVFQPGFGQPTMSLADFADGQMEMFGEMERRQKEADEMRKHEEEKDQDKDEQSDRKTLEERAWDDWKDENEKGGGNKKRY